MSLSVAARGHAIASFRFVEVRLMETAACWTPTTAEMEVKVLLGKHIWDFAQHADALGKRTFELRLPLQHTLAPAATYVSLLDDVRLVEETADRMAALYQALIPGLERRYRGYVERTDGLLDAPSVVILERILLDLSRQRREAEAVCRELELPRREPADFVRREQAAEFDVPHAPA